jgi:hypothetical protein
MELSPTREAANCAATQELLSILWNPRVRYRVHKSPPLIPVLSQINPIHTIPSYLSNCKLYFNIVHPPKSRSSQWSLSFWLSHQYPIFMPLNICHVNFARTHVLVEPNFHAMFSKLFRCIREENWCIYTCICSLSLYI